MLPHADKKDDGYQAVNSGVGVKRFEFTAVYATLQDFFEQGVTGLHHLGFIKLHHFGEVAGFTGDQFGDAAGGGVADALPPGLHGIADHLGRAALEFVKLLVPDRKVVRQIALYHRFEQIFLGVEVQKKRAFGNTRPKRNFLHLGGRKAFFDKQAQRGIQQFLRAGFFAPLALVRGKFG